MPTLHLISNYSVFGDIVDTDTDLLKIELPDTQNITITKVSISSLTAATGAATIIVGNQANNAGDKITVTFSNGEYYAEQTGNIETTSSFFWIHSANPENLSNINVSIKFNY